MSRLAIALAFLPLVAPAPCPAAVVAVLNATDKEVAFTVEHPDAKPAGVTLAAGECRAVPVGRRPVLRVTLNGKPAAFNLDPYTPYLFTRPKDGEVAFSGVELAARLPAPDDVPPAPAARKPLVVPVALYADDAQPMTRAAWEKAAKARLAGAAQVLEQQAGVTFPAADGGEWAAAKDAADWPAALADFALKATLKPGGRAVGFTSRPVPGDGYGCVPEPGCTHLLVRDHAPRSDADRTEVLVHHLGLWLGAVRSPDRWSVMRATAGDGQANQTDFRVQFDPLNLLVVHVWAEELAAKKGPKVGDLRPKARARLFALYKTLADVHAELKTGDALAREYADRIKEAQADDPASSDGKAEADEKKGENKSAATPTPRPQGERGAADDAVRVVVQAVTAKAKELAKREAARPKGDALTAEYVAAAAVAAETLEPAHRGRGFLVGLGIALDDSTVLRGKPVVRKVCEAAETDEERKERIAALGLPTVRGRRDLCQHFAVSAALTELFGAAAAEFAGLSKELADANGGSGFSFADLAADLAGIELAAAVAKEPKRIAGYAKGGFSADDHVPDVKGFAEGLSAERFKKDYGGADDPRLKKAVDEVRAAVKGLPGYKK
jgi:hypothetical protein